MCVSIEHSFERHLSNSSLFDHEAIGSQSARRRSPTGEAAVTSTAKTVVRDAAIVYGLTFAAGLCMAAAGITLENNSFTASLWNLLSGVLGFTLVGTRLSANRAEHLAWVAVNPLDLQPYEHRTGTPNQLSMDTQRPHHPAHGVP
jgi:hypothetical protein